MARLTARYIGRRAYEVTAEAKDGKTIRKIFKEPFFKDPKNYDKKLASLVGELSAEEVEVDARDLYNRIRQAAEKQGREFPNLLVK